MRLRPVVNVTDVWKFAVSGAVLGGVAAVLILVGRSDRYVASESIVFVGAPTAAQREFETGRAYDPSDESPLVRFRDTTVVGDMFSRIYRGPSKRSALRERGMVGDLTVSTRRTVASDTPDHGPVLVLDLLGTDAAGIEAGLNLLTDDVQTELARFQGDANPDLSVSIEVVSRTDRAVLIPVSSLRWLGASSAASFLIGYLIGSLAVALTSTATTAGPSGTRRPASISD